jgi:hypothetical protein
LPPEQKTTPISISSVSHHSTPNANVQAERRSVREAPAGVAPFTGHTHSGYLSTTWTTLRRFVSARMDGWVQVGRQDSRNRRYGRGMGSSDAGCNCRATGLPSEDLCFVSSSSDKNRSPGGAMELGPLFRSLSQLPGFGFGARATHKPLTGARRHDCECEVQAPADKYGPVSLHKLQMAVSPGWH